MLSGETGGQSVQTGWQLSPTGQKSLRKSKTKRMPENAQIALSEPVPVLFVVALLLLR